MAGDETTWNWNGGQRGWYLLELRFEGPELIPLQQIGRIVVLPVLPLKDNGGTSREPVSDDGDPVMLVALNARESVDWDRLRISVCFLLAAEAGHVLTRFVLLRPRNLFIILKSP